MTLHFRDQRGAASVRYRNLAEITVHPSLETRAWEQLENSLLWFLFFVFYFFNSPTINSKKFYVQNGSEVVWSNKTVKWTYKYLIFAVDGGSPKRGDSISVTITFDVSCESTGAIVADPVTGDVFFRAPGLTGSIYRKTLVWYNIYLPIN